MALPSVKVSNRYQIAVPQQARKRLKIKSGDRLIVDVQDGMIVLLPEPENYTQLLAGLHREIWEKSGDYLIGERNAWTDSSKS
jgi:AbrB family looped-hinge helix DNA binding protein